ncbi:MAG: ABC transporter permease subunit [Planctomycetota bacterium]|jgi:microcin C transport system permease protein
MAAVGFVIKIVIVLGLGYLLTIKIIPWLYVKIARLLGFKAKMTPITRKRVARFKSIKRGFWSFRIITTLFVVSLFLELLVNDKALVIYYDGKIAFPAFAELADGILFFATISSYNAKEDFGQIGTEPVDYREFAKNAGNPEQMRANVDAEIAELDAAFAKLEADKPGPKTRKSKKRRYERKLRQLNQRRKRVEAREAKVKVFEEGGAWCLMPLYPYSHRESRLDLEKNPPNPPSSRQGIPLGTDMSGRDIVTLMLYGFRISLAFALLVAACGYCFGIIFGGIMGYYGGWTDIILQRIVEIWGSIPFLFTIMIIASILTPNFILLAVLLIVLRSWLSMTYYLRAEFYREKAKDYVQAAIGAGVSDWKIITRHIIPNSLVPVVTFAPFGIVSYIGILVSLDYLGFGLPPGTPSWGALLRQGLENVRDYPHLVTVPVVALAATLYCVVIIGEAVREAFDPKVFSRLR